MKDRYDLEAEMKRRRISNLEIARRANVSAGYPWLVIHGIRRNAAIERAIGRAVGIPVAQVRHILRGKDEQAAA